MENSGLIKDILESRNSYFKAFFSSPEIISKLNEIARSIISCYNEGGKVFFCGNGGSAADAQHLSAELSGKFYFDRDPLPSEALHTNSSYLTAVSNDISFEESYARLIKANGRKGDILVALSTSGKSKNIIRAVEEANRSGILTIGFTGKDGGKLIDISSLCLRVPSNDTPVIQEMHIISGHIICQVVESILFKK